MELLDVKFKHNAIQSLTPIERYVLCLVFTLLPFRVEKVDTDKESLILAIQVKGGLGYLDIWFRRDSFEKWVIQQPKVTFINDIPTLYVDKKPTNLFSAGHCGFDLINSVFYLVSRQEEYQYRHRDQWECFVASYTLLHTHGIIHRPLINLWVHELEKDIRSIAKQQGVQLDEIPRWPEGHTFAVALTHDVDVVRSGVLRYSFQSWCETLASGKTGAILRRTAGLARDAVSIASQGVKEQHFFEEWMKLEDDYGVRSSFYFIPLVSYRNKYDSRYTFDELIHFRGRRRALADVMCILEKEGWEVGLHGSYNSYRDSKKLAAEKKQIEKVINKEVTGIRQHYLRFDAKTTWRAQEQAGFQYDTTLGYNEAPGYRAGIAFPFFPFDATENRHMNILELPITIMDSTLFALSNFKLDCNKAIERCVQMIDEVAETNGLITLLWHSNYRNEIDYPGWWLVYKELLGYVYQKGAWVTSGVQLMEFWRERLKHINFSGL